MSTSENKTVGRILGWDEIYRTLKEQEDEHISEEE